MAGMRAIQVGSHAHFGIWVALSPHYPGNVQIVISNIYNMSFRNRFSGGLYWWILDLGSNTNSIRDLGAQKIESKAQPRHSPPFEMR